VLKFKRVVKTRTWRDAEYLSWSDVENS